MAFLDQSLFQDQPVVATEIPVGLRDHTASIHLQGAAQGHCPQNGAVGVKGYKSAFLATTCENGSSRLVSCGGSRGPGLDMT